VLEGKVLMVNKMLVAITIIVLPSQQQVAKYLIKFKILTLALDFLILKILASNGYKK
jgi:hypothetical protein